MAEDDSNSSNYSSGRNTILWGLSFGVASAIAFKAVGAIFPQRCAAEKSSNGNEKEKINPSQVIIPAINMPPNEVENISQNSQNIPSQPKPKVPGHAVPCDEVLDLYKDCMTNYDPGNKCDSYPKIMEQFCSGSATAYADSTLLLKSYQGCTMLNRYPDFGGEACKRKYNKLMGVRQQKTGLFF